MGGGEQEGAPAAPQPLPAGGEAALAFPQGCCNNCLKAFPAESLKACGVCRMVSYCSRECQRLAWKAGHKLICAQLSGKGNLVAKPAAPLAPAAVPASGQPPHANGHSLAPAPEPLQVTQASLAAPAHQLQSAAQHAHQLAQEQHRNLQEQLRALQEQHEQQLRARDVAAAAALQYPQAEVLHQPEHGDWDPVFHDQGDGNPCKCALHAALQKWNHSAAAAEPLDPEHERWVRAELERMPAGLQQLAAAGVLGYPPPPPSQLLSRARSGQQPQQAGAQPQQLSPQAQAQALQQHQGSTAAQQQQQLLQQQQQALLEYQQQQLHYAAAQAQQYLEQTQQLAAAAAAGGGHYPPHSAANTHHAHSHTHAHAPHGVHQQHPSRSAAAYLSAAAAAGHHQQQLVPALPLNPQLQQHRQQQLQQVQHQLAQVQQQHSHSHPASDSDLVRALESFRVGLEQAENHVMLALREQVAAAISSCEDLRFDPKGPVFEAATSDFQDPSCMSRVIRRLRAYQRNLEKHQAAAREVLEFVTGQTPAAQAQQQLAPGGVVGRRPLAALPYNGGFEPHRNFRYAKSSTEASLTLSEAKRLADQPRPAVSGDPRGAAGASAADFYHAAQHQQHAAPANEIEWDPETQEILRRLHRNEQELDRKVRLFRRLRYREQQAGALHHPHGLPPPQRPLRPGTDESDQDAGLWDLETARRDFMRVPLGSLGHTPVVWRPDADPLAAPLTTSAMFMYDSDGYYDEDDEDEDEDDDDLGDEADEDAAVSDDGRYSDADEPSDAAAAPKASSGQSSEAPPADGKEVSASPPEAAQQAEEHRQRRASQESGATNTSQRRSPLGHGRPQAAPTDYALEGVLSSMGRRTVEDFALREPLMLLKFLMADGDCSTNTAVSSKASPSGAASSSPQPQQSPPAGGGSGASQPQNRSQATPSKSKKKKKGGKQQPSKHAEDDFDFDEMPTSGSRKKAGGGGDGLTPEERRREKEFIRDCIEKVRLAQFRRVVYVRAELERMREAHGINVDISLDHIREVMERSPGLFALIIHGNSGGGGGSQQSPAGGASSGAPPQPNLGNYRHPFRHQSFSAQHFNVGQLIANLLGNHSGASAAAAQSTPLSAQQGIRDREVAQQMLAGALRGTSTGSLSFWLDGLTQELNLALVDLLGMDTKLCERAPVIAQAIAEATNDTAAVVEWLEISRDFALMSIDDQERRAYFQGRRGGAGGDSLGGAGGGGLDIKFLVNEVERRLRQGHTPSGLTVGGGDASGGHGDDARMDLGHHLGFAGFLVDPPGSGPSPSIPAGSASASAAGASNSLQHGFLISQISYYIQRCYYEGICMECGARVASLCQHLRCAACRCPYDHPGYSSPADHLLHPGHYGGYHQAGANHGYHPHHHPHHGYNLGQPQDPAPIVQLPELPLNS